MSSITIKADDKGSFYVTCEYSDSTGAVTPETVNWSLTDNLGNIINSRYQTSLTPATSNLIVLGADDTSRDDGTERIFTVEGTYNSVTYGNGQILKEQEPFSIDDWVEIIVV